MFFGWLVVVMLYWSPLPFLGYGASMALALYSLKSGRKIYLDRKVAIFVIFGICSYGAGLFLHGFEPTSKSINTLVHFATLCIFLSLARIEFNQDHVSLFAKIYAFGAYASTLTLGTELASLFYFIDESGAKRFSFLFAEPSFLGLFSAMLCFLLLSYGAVKKKVDYFVISALIGLVFLSLSGSGLFVLGISFIALFFSKPLSKALIGRFFALSLVAVFALSMLYVSDFGGFLFDRIENFFKGGDDRSAELRFIATAMLLDYTVENNFWFGSGFGLHAEYISRNYNNFIYLLKLTFEGDDVYNTNIDNGWVFIIFSSGFFGFLVILSAYLASAIKALGYRSFFVLVFSMLFFSGAFIHPLFLGMFFIRFPRVGKEASNKIEIRGVSLAERSEFR
ncbi:O-antigen ligase family protein [Zoogloea sp.]|uniref:O-antigen ligase family protein n=1 Tax=Zoogloea sp. TaxID=49181 RepID=UPI0026263553|nr:O-antigen ligase family protein [Zoogloea sp.]